MGIGSRLAEAVGAAWKTAFPVIEASKSVRMVEAAGKTVDEDIGWRRLTGDSNRNLSPVTQARARKMSHWQWQANMLANRLIELPLAYLLAEGVTMTAKDEEANAILDRFWKHPINAMDLKLEKMMREGALDGEQCWPVFVNPYNGAVQLGYLESGLIETVVMDPGNASQPIGVVTTKDGKGKARRFRVIVIGPEEVFTAAAQEIRKTFTDGDCFFFAFNSLMNGGRGRPDLLASADWLDAYERGMFGEIERAELLKLFIWEVTLTGASQAEVDERARKIATPKGRSVRVTNENETWKAVTPGLNAVDTAEGMRMFRNHILGGSTIPEHWYGGGADVNRSTGESMGDPTIKMLTRRQRLWKIILETVGAYVIWRAGDPAGTGDPMVILADPEVVPTANFPELTSKDTTAFATALAQTVSAAAMAVTAGLLSQQTAVALIALVAGQLGLEIDPAAELAAALEDKAKQAEADSFVPPAEDPAAPPAGKDAPAAA